MKQFILGLVLGVSFTAVGAFAQWGDHELSHELWMETPASNALQAHRRKQIQLMKEQNKILQQRNMQNLMNPC